MYALSYILGYGQLLVLDESLSILLDVVAIALCVIMAALRSRCGHHSFAVISIFLLSFLA